MIFQKFPGRCLISLANSLVHVHHDQVIPLKMNRDCRYSLFIIHEIFRLTFEIIEIPTLQHPFRHIPVKRSNPVKHLFLPVLFYKLLPMLQQITHVRTINTTQNPILEQKPVLSLHPLPGREPVKILFSKPETLLSFEQLQLQLNVFPQKIVGILPRSISLVHPGYPVIRPHPFPDLRHEHVCRFTPDKLVHDLSLVIQQQERRVGPDFIRIRILLAILGQHIQLHVHERGIKEIGNTIQREY